MAYPQNLQLNTQKNSVFLFGRHNGKEAPGSNCYSHIVGTSELVRTTGQTKMAVLPLVFLVFTVILAIAHPTLWETLTAAVAPARTTTH
jgi:hypothetical protein